VALSFYTLLYQIHYRDPVNPQRLLGLQPFQLTVCVYMIIVPFHASVPI